MGPAKMNERKEISAAVPAAAVAAGARPGITLVEIMIAMAIMTIGVLGMVGAFKFFNVGVQSAKTRSLANNIAQERIEFLKNKSYYRVLVTTAAAEDPNFAPGEMTYDVAPNGEETVNVGGITFKRRVYIRKVNEDPDKNLQYMAWNEPDPGLKEIKVYVAWFERGEWRKLEVRNLRENPSRVNESSTIRGTVTKSGGGALAGVVVRAQESPSYYGESATDGTYSFSVVAGTYTLLATKDYFFPAVRPSFGVSAGAAATGKDFTLTEMSSGNISGYALLRDHLVISNIVGSTETVTGDTEWVEVYNPTTWTWTMATGLGTAAGNEKIVFRYKETGSVERLLDFNYINTTVTPGHYYLFSNTGTVTAAGVTRQADAVYTLDGNWADQDDVIKTGSPSNAGFVQLKDAVTGRVFDTVGWTAYAQPWPQYWPDSYENFGVYYFIPGWTQNTMGLEKNMAFTRNSWFSTINSADASCFDSNSNYYDFYINKPITYGPRNTVSTQTCVSGSTAEGAIVFADDGISSPVQAGWGGYFSLSPVSTGTWTVYMSSGVVYSSVAYYGGTANNYWAWAGYNQLSTPTTFGYVTGRVTNIYGAAMSNIKMYAPGSNPVFTNATGRYTLPVDAGVVTVRANYQSYSPSYVELSSADIVVDIGEVQQGVDFSLYQGGRIRGKITTNGVDPLPNIPVIGLKDGVEQGSGISGSDGYFTISGTGISTGTYVVVPQLEVGESASPSSTTVTVQAGLTAFSSTYTISGAFGTLTGSVTKSGSVITTGVMIYVTTSTLAAGAGPPDITPALRSGSAVYYAGSSSALGTYSISVKGGYTYNVYAWYATWTTGNNPVPTTVRKEATGVAVSPNATVTRSFAW